MRNIGKFTAVILAVVLVLTSMPAVFAANSATLANADKAVTLKDLGLYSGTDTNDPMVGLGDALTTQESLIFLAKLFGYYEAASKLTDDEVNEALAKFDDVASISDYAKNVVAYSAKKETLLGCLEKDRLFVGAKDTVTAARFATFMLKQMGYKVADYKQSVAKLAETKGSKIDATLTGDLTRDAAVGMMFGALTAEKPSGKTVIADIVGDNADLKIKAKRAGLLVSETDQTELSVEKDTSAPVITAGAVNRTSNTEGTIKFTSNEAGSYYYLIVDDEELEPIVDTSGVGTDCTTAGTTIINLTGLTAGTKDIYIKVKDAAGNVSDAVKIVVPAYVAPNTDQDAPTGLEGAAPTTYGGTDGKITNVDTAMEYKLSTATDWTPVEGTEINGLGAGTYNIRYAAKDGYNAGTAAEVTVAEGPNADQDAPTGLAGVAPTDALNDGKITGTTIAMEYKLATAEDSAYVACSDTETVVAAAGDYVVRLAAKTGFNSGATAAVTVPAWGYTNPEVM